MHNRLNNDRAFKIFFVCYNYWDLYNFRLDVLKHFINLGYDVHTVALKDEYAGKILDIGCKVHYIKFDNRSLNPFSDIKLFISLKKIYRLLKPDFIFHYAIKPNIYGSIAASQLKIPSVAIITGLGYAFASNGWLSRLVIQLYRYALKNVDCIWVLNKADKNVLITKKIAPLHKIDFLHSEGINTGRFKPVSKQDKNQKFVFLMATRILWSKGVGIFAEASEILQQKGLDFKCRLIGKLEINHPNGIPLETIKEWQDKNLLEYLGFFENIIPSLAVADCFVLPTYYNEGVPRSLLEACAMELPVIATNNSGCKEVVQDNFNGFICELKSPKDLAEKMEKILFMDVQKLARLGNNGRTLVKEYFDINLIIKQYEETININR